MYKALSTDWVEMTWQWGQTYAMKLRALSLGATELPHLVMVTCVVYRHCLQRRALRLILITAVKIRVTVAGPAAAAVTAGAVAVAVV